MYVQAIVVNLLCVVGPLALQCSLNENTEAVCASSNELDSKNITCSFRGVITNPCMYAMILKILKYFRSDFCLDFEGVLPHKINVSGLALGAHEVQVMANDVFGSTATANFNYLG